MRYVPGFLHCGAYHAPFGIADSLKLLRLWLSGWVGRTNHFLFVSVWFIRQGEYWFSGLGNSSSRSAGPAPMLARVQLQSETRQRWVPPISWTKRNYINSNTVLHFARNMPPRAGAWGWGRGTELGEPKISQAAAYRSRCLWDRIRPPRKRTLESPSGHIAVTL
jgi:hypothetical protein